MGTSQQWFIGMVVNEEKMQFHLTPSNSHSADGLFERKQIVLLLSY
jgi:hypothetical protein